MKRVILIVSETFPKAHPKSGEPTLFVKKIHKGMKIHTLRKSYPYWKKKIDMVLRGEAALHIRVWSGKPYRSPQREILKLTSHDGVGIQKVMLTDEKKLVISESGIGHWIAKNDGLNSIDFASWFKDVPTEPMALIHFTPFRYE